MAGRNERGTRADGEQNSREALIGKIRRRLEGGGTPPGVASKRGPAPSAGEGLGRFEDARREPVPVLKPGDWSIWTWNPAAEVEMFDPLRNGLIQAVKVVAGEVGPDVTFPEFRRRTGHSRSLVVKHFGTWGQLRVEAGLERVSKRPQALRYRSEDILARLRALVAERGPRITRAEFTRATGISDTAITRHFGGWSKLRKRAGLVPRLEVAKRLSDDDLLEAYDKVVRRLGRLPTEEEFNRYSKRCRMQTLYLRFGRKAEIEGRYREWVAAGG